MRQDLFGWLSDVDHRHIAAVVMISSTQTSRIEDRAEHLTLVLGLAQAFVHLDETAEFFFPLVVAEAGRCIDAEQPERDHDDAPDRHGKRCGHHNDDPDRQGDGEAVRSALLMA